MNAHDISSEVVWRNKAHLRKQRTDWLVLFTWLSAIAASLTVWGWLATKLWQWWR